MKILIRWDPKDDSWWIPVGIHPLPGYIGAMKDEPTHDSWWWQGLDRLPILLEALRRGWEEA